MVMEHVLQGGSSDWIALEVNDANMGSCSSTFDTLLFNGEGAELD